MPVKRDANTLKNSKNSTYPIGYGCLWSATPKPSRCDEKTVLMNRAAGSMFYSRSNRMIGLVLTDLNDFITPSQACIKPPPKPTTQQNQEWTVGKDDDIKQEAAKISLNDCLACSGCITSAESVLIAIQSQEEIYKLAQEQSHLKEQGLPRKWVVVSLSYQSLASLASKYGLSVIQVYKKLTWLFRSHFGFDMVLDIGSARDVSLTESAKSFLNHYQSTQLQGSPKPLLASACPGWICYAEKTHPDSIPFIDTTKSPQQIMGSLLKSYLAQQFSGDSSLTPDRVYHVTVMPCYDKKLEASRADFYNDIYSTRDVDCVIATNEVERILVEQNLNLVSIPESPISNPLFKGDASQDIMYTSEGSASGGYLSFILRYSVFHLYGVSLSPSDIEQGTNGISIIEGRNSDMKTIQYTPPGGSEPTLVFGYMYGFRNIQNLVRKLPSKGSSTGTRGKSMSAPRKRGTQGGHFHYVEVMACPSGCINGGGQLKPADITNGMTMGPQASKKWIDQALQRYVSPNESAPSIETTSQMDVDSTHASQPVHIMTADKNPMVEILYRDWLQNDAALIQTHLHTQYHAVPPMESEDQANGLAVKW